MAPLDYKNVMMIAKVVPEDTALGIPCQLPIHKILKWIVPEMIVCNT